MLLLHCTRKQKKGPHYQLPGGHVDDFEFEAAYHRILEEQKNRTGGEEDDSDLRILDSDVILLAAKMGAARELYEETGINVQSELHRLEPIMLQMFDDENKGKKKMSKLESYSLKNRCYFHLLVSDDDFLKEQKGDLCVPSIPLKVPMNDHGSDLKLRLSHEHSGFLFEPDPMESIQKLTKHSGGMGSLVLRQSMNIAARLEKIEIQQQAKKEKRSIPQYEEVGKKNVELLSAPKKFHLNFCCFPFCA